jgi:DsbC/DsbD-like thiol-disulfide interchange protein
MLFAIRAQRSLTTLCASLLIGLSSPTVAEDRFANLAELDVLDGGWTSRGTYQAALRVRLAEGWKTYWRSPGDAGIPPSVSWKGSRNVGQVMFTWPTPDVFDTAGLRTLGYHDEMILPVEITPKRPGAPLRLRGEMQLGVCKEVCIPTELAFTHRPNPEATRNPVIAAALAARPFSAEEAGVTAATCRLKPGAYGLKVEARVTMPSAGGSEIAVIESGSTDIVAGETTAERSGGQIIARTELFSLDDGPFAIDRSDLRITILGRNHAVDIHGCTAG